jgi:hypothetical protein
MSLDNRIVMLLENYPNRALHWWEIRNELVMELNINNVESLSVKLSRALKRLLREGIVEKHDSSHRNVTYSLSKNYQRELERKYAGTIRGVVQSTFPGVYEPGDSYEKVKRKARRQWIEYFERYEEPELRRAYEEMKKRESHE